MVGKYEITQGNKTVGTMEVSREGLYYRFRGKCNLEKAQISRIKTVCGDRAENLGVLLPCNSVFLLDTRRPIKMFANAVPTFTLISDDDERDNWMPLKENTPFSELEALKNGVFQKREGVPGILFTDSAPSQQDSDPNP